MVRVWIRESVFLDYRLKQIIVSDIILEQKEDVVEYFKVSINYNYNKFFKVVFYQYLIFWFDWVDCGFCVYFYWKKVFLVYLIIFLVLIGMLVEMIDLVKYKFCMFCFYLFFFVFLYL